MSILQWCWEFPEHNTNDTSKIKRLEMKASNGDIEAVTPAWILVEFAEPTEARDLDHFHGRYDIVRTARLDGHYEDRKVGTFKSEHVLLDPDGNPMEEPGDEFVEGILKMKRRSNQCIQGTCTWLVLTIFFLVTSRIYARSCFHKYKSLTIARLKNRSFPVPLPELLDMTARCSLKYTGTELEEGVRPCRPNITQIYDTCTPQSEGGAFPEGQPPAKATFDTLRVQYQIEIGLRCLGGQHLCYFFHEGEEFEVLGAMVCILLMMVACCGRCFILDRVKQMTRERAKMIEQQHKRNQDERHENRDQRWHEEGYGLLAQSSPRTPRTPRTPRSS